MSTDAVVSGTTLLVVLLPARKPTNAANMTLAAIPNTLMGLNELLFATLVVVYCTAGSFNAPILRRRLSGTSATEDCS